MLLGAIGIGCYLNNFSTDEWTDFEFQQAYKWLEIAYICACSIVLVTIATILIYVTNDALMMTIPITLGGIVGIVFSTLEICTIWWTLMFLACSVVLILIVQSVLAAIVTCVRNR